MPKQRIKPEYTVELSRGVAVYINQLGDIDGEKCFLITDVAGKSNSFVITGDALPLDGEKLTAKQKIIAQQLKKTIAEMINS
jgi:hypothetical protein